MMGFLRAILPFAASFQGSRLGRQLVRTNERHDESYLLSSTNGETIHFGRDLHTFSPALFSDV
jgi:hypothetical protein